MVGGINTYLYANAAPTMYTDPTGEVANVAIGAVLGGISGGVGAALQGGSATQILAGVGLGALGGATFGLFPAAGLVNTLGVGGLAILRGGAGGIGNVLGQSTVAVVRAPSGSAIDPCFQFNFGAFVGATVGAATFGTLNTQIGAALSQSGGASAATRFAFGVPGALGQGTVTAIGGSLGQPMQQSSCGCRP